MVPLANIIACIVTLVISLLLPLAILLFYALRHKKQGVVVAWLLGAAGFFVPQILIRLPILSVLQLHSGFMEFAQSHLLIYSLGLAATAALFEAAGRFGVAKLMSKRLTWRRSVAAGLGHGGIEAIFLIGMAYINNLLYILFINTGMFDTLIAQSVAAGVDAAQLELIRTQLITTAPGMFLLAGLERIFAMVCHTAMSALVCYGVARKKTVPSLALCFAIHMLIDLTSSLTLFLPKSTAYPIIYGVLALMAAISVALLLILRRRWQATAENP